MTKEELVANLASIRDEITSLEIQAQELKENFLKEHAKFKVGDRVRCQGWLSEIQSKDLPEMYGTLLSAGLTWDLRIYYGVRPDKEAKYWSQYGQLFRNEDMLHHVTQVTIS